MRLTDDQINAIVADITARLVGERKISKYLNKAGTPGYTGQAAVFEYAIRAALLAAEVNA